MGGGPTFASKANYLWIGGQRANEVVCLLPSMVLGKPEGDIVEFNLYEMDDSGLHPLR